MEETLVEISCQKAWTRELRLASAWSLSSGAGSCSIASREPAELTITAAAAMSAAAYEYRSAAEGFASIGHGLPSCCSPPVEVWVRVRVRLCYLAWSRRRSRIRF